jgi:hypothetical protein
LAVLLLLGVTLAKTSCDGQKQRLIQTPSKKAEA